MFVHIGPLSRKFGKSQISVLLHRSSRSSSSPPLFALLSYEKWALNQIQKQSEHRISFSNSLFPFWFRLKLFFSVWCWITMPLGGRFNQSPKTRWTYVRSPIWVFFSFLSNRRGFPLLDKNFIKRGKGLTKEIKRQRKRGKK